MNNISNINGANINMSSNELPSDIKKAQKYYNDFVQQMNKSDFCNTDKRYLAELVYVRKLEEFYSQNNANNLLKEMEKRESDILNILKNDFGITMRQ